MRHPGAGKKLPGAVIHRLRMTEDRPEAPPLTIGQVIGHAMGIYFRSRASSRSIMSRAWASPARAALIASSIRAHDG